MRQFGSYGNGPFRRVGPSRGIAPEGSGFRSSKNNRNSCLTLLVLADLVNPAEPPKAGGIAYTQER